MTAGKSCMTLCEASERISKGKERSIGDMQILTIFGSNGVQIGVLWVCNPMGKLAQGLMYHKNPNTAGYDPVGSLRKLVKRPRSRGDR